MLSGTVVVSLVKLLSVSLVNKRDGDKPILPFYKQVIPTFMSVHFCHIMFSCFARLIMPI